MAIGDGSFLHAADGYAGSPAQKADREQKKFKRTLTCGHAIMVTFKKNAHYCESCRARRRPIAGADEERESSI